MITRHSSPLRSTAQSQAFEVRLALQRSRVYVRDRVQAQHLIKGLVRDPLTVILRDCWPETPH